MPVPLPKYKKKRKAKITHKRLRTENRLLRQRIDYLEHESSALADRLIRGQVDLAQQAENSLNISHELNTLRDINGDAHRRLEEAYETIRELSTRREADGSSSVEIGIQVDDMDMIEHIHSLQQELIEAHSRKSDLENHLRELKLRIAELECANKRLKESPPDDGIASLQEELIRVKMREAEASLSLRDMRQRLAELETAWTRYTSRRPSLTASQSTTSVDTTTDGSSRAASPQHSPSLPGSTNGTGTLTNGNVNGTSANPAKTGRFAKLTAFIGAATTGASGPPEDDGPTLRELEDQLMGLKIKEADAVAELKEMRQKVMELETQNHVCTNQLKRQDDELKRVREEKEAAVVNEQKAATLLKEEQRKLEEAQSDMKEASVMQRLKYTEAMQTIADLKQNIAQLESKIAEKAAHAQLRGGSIVSDMDDDSAQSQRSGSYGDSNSIASEEMSAFIADVTTKAHLLETPKTVSVAATAAAGGDQ
uniref:GRIP domain-containing protein n=1 Tax=Panagrellus redivivus TaxID=6233 RepID=A0A7E4VME3_PANRE